MCVYPNKFIRASKERQGDGDTVTAITAITIDRIGNNSNEKKIYTALHQITIGCKKMFDEKLLVKHMHGMKNFLMLVDRFEPSILGQKEFDVRYRILTLEEATEIAHDDRVQVYACIASEKMKKVYEKYLKVTIPTVTSIDECRINIEEFDEHTYILLPLISQCDLEKEENKLDNLFFSRDIRFVLIKKPD